MDTCPPDTYRPRLDNSEQKVVVREPRERFGREGERDGPIKVRDELLNLTEPIRSNDKQPVVAASLLLGAQEPTENDAAATRRERREGRAPDISYQAARSPSGRWHNPEIALFDPVVARARTVRDENNA
jgi:hypothetical protein